MSHHIYTTAGFVVESRPHGEAGKFLHIFTRDLGMIGGVAQGIRLSQSKLRYHAQDFSLATFSLVRGKEVWRIVGAQESGDELSEKSSIAKKSSVSPSVLFVRIMKTLRRLVAGEEKNEALFDTVISSYNFLHDKGAPEKVLETKTEAADANIECIIMLRILHSLGYVRNVPDLKIFLDNNTFTPELISSMDSIRPKAVKEINAALKESHL